MLIGAGSAVWYAKVPEEEPDPDREEEEDDEDGRLAEVRVAALELLLLLICAVELALPDDTLDEEVVRATPEELLLLLLDPAHAGSGVLDPGKIHDSHGKSTAPSYWRRSTRATTNTMATTRSASGAKYVCG